MLRKRKQNECFTLLFRMTIKMAFQTFEEKLKRMNGV